MDVTREIQESLMNAIQHTSNKTVMNSNATCTIDCEIVEVVDPALGEYKIKVNDNIITAYGKPSDTYTPGDLVQVLFPKGNDQESGGAAIINAVLPKANVYVEDITDSYINISENLIDYTDEIQLSTYHDEIRYIPNPESGIPAWGVNFGTLFTDYLKDYNFQKFSVNIMTNIEPEQQVAGNYGIKLQIPILVDDGTSVKVPDQYDISMDVNTIQGNPYDLSTWSLQNVYVTFPADLEYDNTIYIDEETQQNYQRKPILIAFVDDFAQDENKQKYDIYIKDFNFQAVQTVPTEKLESNYLSIVCDTGRSFLGENETKVLKLDLKVKGKSKKISEENYSCFQFKENAAIKSTSDKYSSRGGVGWECLNQKTEMGTNDDGTKSYQQIYNNFELAVEQDEVYSTLRYKCTLVDNETNENIIGYITLINVKHNNVSFDLISSNGETSFIKNLGTISLTARLQPTEEMQNVNSTYSVEQQRFDQKNNPLDNFPYNKIRTNDIIKEVNEETTTDRIEQEINFSTAYIDQKNTVKCTFYRQYTNEHGVVIRGIVGTATILIDTLAKHSYVIIIENGDIVHKYDVDGNSPYVADYGGPISTTNEGIKPISFKVYKADGSELTEDEYKYCEVSWAIPKNSMIKWSGTPTYEDNDYMYIVGKYNQISQLQYNIDNVYDKSKFNNEILISVKYNDEIIRNSANIKFLKDGESGTNGSKYTAVILQNGHPYGAYDENGYITKLQLIYNGDDRDSENGKKQYYYNRPASAPVRQDSALEKYKKLTVDVYCNGIHLENFSGSIIQEIFDKTSTSPIIDINRDTGVISIPNGKTWDGLTPTSNVIRATIRVGNEGITQSQEVIYAYYSIEVSYITNKMCNPAIPNITGGYENVLYASDGTNPKYNNNKEFIYSDNIDNGINIVGGTNYYTFEQFTGLETSRTLESGVIEDYKNLEIEGANNKSSCMIKPKTKFDSGISLNYIKVKMTNTDYAGRLQTQYRQLYGEQENLNSEQKKQVKICDAISTEPDGVYPNQGLKEKFYNKCVSFRIDNKDESFYNYINYLLEDSKSFIIQRTKLYDILIRALEELTIFRNYYNNFDKLNDSIKEDYNEKADRYEAEIKQRITHIVNYGKPNIEIIRPSSLENCQFDIIQNNRIFYMLQQAAAAYNKCISIYNSLVNNQIPNYSRQQEFLNQLEYFSNNEYYENIHNQLYGREYPYQNVLKSTENDTTYMDLQGILLQLNNNLYNEEGLIYTYSDIKEKVIDEYDRLISEYTDESFYKRYRDVRDDLKIQADVKEIEANKCYSEQEYANANSAIQHTKPIVMLFNIYEQSFLSEQDGNKLYIDEENGQYIIAPRMGAGIKEEVQEQSGDKKRLFTGVVMGVEQNEHKSDGGIFTQKVGLFGYSKGIQSIFLNARDGSATFGISSSGQIKIEPSTETAVIKSGSYNYSPTYDVGKGMMIDFATPEIKFGSNRFRVESNGKVYAAGGTIGGQNIEPTYLESNDRNNGIKLDSNNNAIYFKNTAGKIYSGSHNAINSSANGFQLSQDGLSIGSKFKATNTGIVYIGTDANNASSEIADTNKCQAINGNGTNSYIGFKTNQPYFTYEDNHLNGIDTTAAAGHAKSKEVYIGTDGIRLGTKFAVDSKGDLFGNYVTLNGGKIGNQNISSGKIIGNPDSDNKQLILDADGKISGGKSGASNQSINRDGTATFNNVTIEGGSLSIGGKANIDSNGDATFSSITATGTINALDGYLGLEANTVNSNGIAFNGGSISLTTNEATAGAAKKDDKITQSSSNGLTIHGDIHARSGYFSGEIVATSGTIGGTGTGEYKQTIGTDGIGISGDSDGGSVYFTALYGRIPKIYTKGITQQGGSGYSEGVELKSALKLESKTIKDGDGQDQTIKYLTQNNSTTSPGATFKILTSSGV